jgi:hypothetical protein
LLYDLVPELPKITYLVEDLICKEITKIVQLKISGTRQTSQNCALWGVVLL